MVPFCDLRRALQPIMPAIKNAAARVIQSGQFLRGRETAAFEEEWAAFCGQRYCVACGSGTDALTIAATALGLPRAVVPATTSPMTAIGLHRGGTVVEPADISSDGFLVGPTAESVPVLLYGRLPSITELRVCQLFDAAHAHGWQPPSHATVAWSFYPTKSIGALGDAGAVTTNDGVLALKMHNLCGRDDVLRTERQITSRIDELQAAILRVKLKHYTDWFEERQRIAARYAAELPAARLLPGPSLHHLFVVKSDERDELQAFLLGRGIQTKVHFPTPLHRQRAPWGSYGLLPVAEAWCNQVLSLPCYPGLRPDEIEEVCRAIRDWHEQ